jgi:hypothetical protein
MPNESSRSNTQAVVVVVAVVGLLATVGSAALGGFWANRSVERQLESQRATFGSQRSADIQDQRREIYPEYLRAVGQFCVALGRPNGTDEEINKAGIEVLKQGARVLLIAGPALQNAVGDATEELVFANDPFPACEGTRFASLTGSLIDAAQPDLK